MKRVALLVLWLVLLRALPVFALGGGGGPTGSGPGGCVPAGTTILKGNGGGGCTAASAGNDYVAPGVDINTSNQVVGLHGPTLTGALTGVPSGGSTSTLGVNTPTDYDLRDWGAALSNSSFTGTFTSGNTTIQGGPSDFVARTPYPQQIVAHNMGAACTLSGCTSAPSAPTTVAVEAVASKQMVPLSAAFTIAVGTNCAGDVTTGAAWANDKTGVRNYYNQSAFNVVGSGPLQQQYSVSAAAGTCTYTFNSNNAGQFVDIFYQTATPPAGSTNYCFEEVGRDANGGATPVSAPTCVTTATISMPTYQNPLYVVPAAISGAYAIDICESDAGGAYFWAGRVWPVMSGQSFYGQHAWAGEDTNPCTGNTGTGLNDDLTANVTAVGANSITVDTAPGVSGTAPVRHTDDAAFSAYASFVAGLPAGYKGARTVIPANGTLRLKRLLVNSGSYFDIEGQSERSSQIHLWGDGGGPSCTPGNTCTTGAATFANLSAIIIRDVGFTRLNSATGTLVNIGGGGLFEYITMDRVDLGGGIGTDCATPGTSRGQGLYTHTVTGSVQQLQTDQGCFDDPVVFGGAANDFVVSHAGSMNHSWPGRVLSHIFTYGGSNLNITVQGLTIENPWQAIGPFDSANANSISGLLWQNNYQADLGAVNTTNPQGATWTLAGVSNVILGQAACGINNTAFTRNLGVYIPNGSAGGNGTTLIQGMKCNFDGGFIVSDNVANHETLDIIGNQMDALTASEIAIDTKESAYIVGNTFIGQGAGATSIQPVRAGCKQDGSTGVSSSQGFVDIEADQLFASGGSFASPTVLTCSGAGIWNTLLSGVSTVSKSIGTLGVGATPATVATFGTCDSSHEGLTATQTNSTAACSAGTTATSAGSTHCQIYCNGSAWKQTGL